MNNKNPSIGITGIPRLVRGYRRQSWEQNFRYLPDGNAQSTEIFGIILRKGKKRTMVEYALKESHQPIAVADSRVTPILPEKLRKGLPAPDQIRYLFGEFSL